GLTDAGAEESGGWRVCVAAGSGSELLCCGRGGRSAVSALPTGAHAQSSALTARQSNCSSALTNEAATECKANKPPVTSSGSFLRNAGGVSAIFRVRLPAALEGPAKSRRTPLNGLIKILADKT